MTMQEKGMKVAFVVIGIVILLQMVAGVYSSFDTSINKLDDQGRCEADGGTWNATVVNCQVSASNTTFYSYTQFPLGNAGVSIIPLILAAGLIIVAIKKLN